MAHILNSYTVFRDTPYLFHTSTGEVMDVRTRQIVASGEEFLRLLSELGACHNSYSQRHHFDPISIRHFLANTPLTHSPPPGHNGPFDEPSPEMRGLKGEHLGQRWAPVLRDQVPRELGNVEMYRPVGPLATHSLSFGDAILGHGAGFHRAIFIGVIHQRMPDKLYLLALTDQPTRILVFEVSWDAVAPGWPDIHPPNLRLIASLAPDIAGLSRTGNHEIRQRMTTMYPSCYATKSLFPGHTFQESPGVDELWVEPNMSFPVMAKPYGLGDWLHTHSEDRDVSEPSLPVTTDRTTSYAEDDLVWPRPPSHPNLETTTLLSESTIRLPPVPKLPSYPPHAYTATTSPSDLPINTTFTSLWPKDVCEENPLVSEAYRLRPGRVHYDGIKRELVDEEDQQMWTLGIRPRTPNTERSWLEIGTQENPTLPPWPIPSRKYLHSPPTWLDRIRRMLRKAQMVGYREMQRLKTLIHGTP
ncbi:hypothetical protein PQX77_003445 [Marasmius sp. AFHP31]|nr:hypothetical protein PQX77_003445 [Marasmius sp. AFHP31]